MSCHTIVLSNTKCVGKDILFDCLWPLLLQICHKNEITYSHPTYKGLKKMRFNEIFLYHLALAKKGMQ